MVSTSGFFCGLCRPNFGLRQVFVFLRRLGYGAEGEVWLVSDATPGGPCTALKLARVDTSCAPRRASRPFHFILAGAQRHGAPRVRRAVRRGRRAAAPRGGRRCVLQKPRLFARRGSRYAPFRPQQRCAPSRAVAVSVLVCAADGVCRRRHAGLFPPPRRQRRAAREPRALLRAPDTGRPRVRARAPRGVQRPEARQLSLDLPPPSAPAPR